jgi:hypothetical protein
MRVLSSTLNTKATWFLTSPLVPKGVRQAHISSRVVVPVAPVVVKLQPVFSNTAFRLTVSKSKLGTCRLQAVLFWHPLPLPQKLLAQKPWL